MATPVAFELRRVSLHTCAAHDAWRAHRQCTYDGVQVKLGLIDY
jgi:hypothetical protein